MTRPDALAHSRGADGCASERVPLSTRPTIAVSPVPAGAIVCQCLMRTLSCGFAAPPGDRGPRFAWLIPADAELTWLAEHQAADLGGVPRIQARAGQAGEQRGQCRHRLQAGQVRA